MPTRQVELENREKRQREVVAMHERGMTLREIGAAIGRTPELVRGILHTAERRAARLKRWEEVQALARTGNREELLAVPVDDVVFDPEDYRVRNALEIDGVKTLGDLLKQHSAELLRTPNIGTRSLNAIKEALATLGLALNTPHANTWFQLQPPPFRLFVDVWQPIETAPKDGTRVLLFDQYDRERDYACFVGAYADGEVPGRRGWYSIPGGYRKRPSHWVPLPERPK